MEVSKDLSEQDCPNDLLNKSFAWLKHHIISVWMLGCAELLIYMLCLNLLDHIREVRSLQERTRRLLCCE